MMPVFSVLLLFLANFHADAETIYITGTNESKNSQKVLMPLVPSFQGKISEMAEEGIKVEKGDFLLRIDGSSLDSQINAQIIHEAPVGAAILETARVSFCPQEGS